MMNFHYYTMSTCKGMKKRALCPLSGVNLTIKPDVPCFWENVPCFWENVPCFGENVPCFEEKVPCFGEKVPCFEENLRHDQ